MICSLWRMVIAHKYALINLKREKIIAKSDFKLKNVVYSVTLITPFYFGVIGSKVLTSTLRSHINN